MEPSEGEEAFPSTFEDILYPADFFDRDFSYAAVVVPLLQSVSARMPFSVDAAAVT